jgi:hypothetical protein
MDVVSLVHVGVGCLYDWDPVSKWPLGVPLAAVMAGSFEPALNLSAKDTSAEPGRPLMTVGHLDAGFVGDGRWAG